MDFSAIAECERTAAAEAARRESAAMDAVACEVAANVTTNVHELKTNIDSEQETIQRMLLEFDTSLDGPSSPIAKRMFSRSKTRKPRDKLKSEKSMDETAASNCQSKKSSAVLKHDVAVNEPPLTLAAKLRETVKRNEYMDKQTSVYPNGKGEDTPKSDGEINEELSAAALDQDGDTKMSTAQNSQKPASPNAATDAHASSDSSDDDDELIKLIGTYERRSARVAAAAVKSLEEKTSELTPIKGSVFGTLVVAPPSRATQTDQQLDAILKDRNRRAARQKKIVELRNDIKSSATDTGEMDEDEKFFASMAETENRNEEERLRLHDKYYCGLSLFLNEPAIPKPSRVHWRRVERLSKHPLHDLLLNARDDGDNLGVGFRSTVEYCCTYGTFPPNFVAEMLFHRVVYDSTQDEPGKPDRENEFQALVHIVMSATKEVLLPSMKQVLRAYGAVLPSGKTDIHAIDVAPEKSLDKRVIICGNNIEQTIQHAIRNLDRAFALWTAQLDSDMNYSGILGERRSKIRGFSTLTTHRLGIVELCVRVLLSPFGSRLCASLRPLIEAALDGVDDTEWPSFRQRCSRDIVSLTPRLGLLLELVTYLLPIRLPRCRALGLDVAYLAMWRWHAGPAENPIPANVPEEWPTAPLPENRAVSYCLPDIVACMQRIPEFGKTTDVHWCCALMGMLKQCLVDDMVLDWRSEGDIARVNAAVKKFSMCTHRMLFGVPRQNLRLALDAIVVGLRIFLGAKANRELDPVGAARNSKPAQGTISFK